MQNITPLHAVKSILVCKVRLLMMLNLDNKVSDLKGKDCEEDDKAKGDARRDHDGVHCVDQTHLGNGIIIDEGEPIKSHPKS